MKCPFELPIEKEELPQTSFYHIKGWIFPYTEEEADYIVQAINSHEKLLIALQYIVADHPAGLLPNKPKSLLQAIKALKAEK